MNSFGSRMRSRETDLVAPNLLSYVVEGLYYTEPQLLPLLIFIDDDVFNMAHQTKIVYAVPRSVKLVRCYHQRY